MTRAAPAVGQSQHEQDETIGAARPSWPRRLVEISGITSNRKVDAQAYREHLALQSRLRIAWLALVAAVCYPAFNILDNIVFPTLGRTFLLIRLAVTTVILAYAFVGWRRPRSRVASSAVLVGCGLCQAGILVMIFLTGGFHSTYWVGLLVVYAGYVGLTSYGPAMAAAFFGGVQAVYFAGSWIICGPPASVAAVVEAMFFLGAGGGLLVLVSVFNELNRRQVFVAKLTIAAQNAEIARAHAATARALERSKGGRLTGRTLDGRYLLLDVLGRGGTGEVYLARDLRTAEPCAVKLLHPELTDSKDSLRRFLREAEHASAVASDHVVRFLGAGYDATSGHFLVMECVVGEDLGTLFQRRGTVPIAELLPIVDQIARVLEATHAAGIIHRDLKPTNVLLTARDGASFVKLIDFGISKVLAPPAEETTLTATVAILGSLGYMAPEQALGLSASVSAATDVFALGAIVYRGLTGQLAFNGESLANFCLKVCYQPFVPAESLNPSLHPDVTLALALAMAKDPADRIDRPLGFVRMLEAASQGALDADARRRAQALYKAGAEESGATLPAPETPPTPTRPSPPRYNRPVA